MRKDRGTYKVKEKNIVKLSDYYNKVVDTSGKRDILQDLVGRCTKHSTNS